VELTASHRGPVAEMLTGVTVSEDTTSEDTTIEKPISDETPARSAEPVTTLRGASVAVDPRRAAQVAIAVAMTTLAVLVVVFFVVGLHKNDQITSLKQHGVPVEDTVNGCSGLLGGSGSNPVGYRCWGTFTIGGRRYTKDIPGTVFRAPGSKVDAVADPDDPGLVTTVSALASEHASPGVFVVPAILLVALALFAGALVLRMRSDRRRRGAVAP